VENVPAGARARHREQVRKEIQAHAWKQIADAGPSAVSLRAIAKQMGMTAPALYRYFTSRDDLLTALILATYQELAEVVGAAVSTDVPPRTDCGTSQRISGAGPRAIPIATCSPTGRPIAAPPSRQKPRTSWTGSSRRRSRLSWSWRPDTLPRPRERRPSSAGDPTGTTVVVSSVPGGPCADPSGSGPACMEC
jgi:AcrR family transcriptional regulator